MIYPKEEVIFLYEEIRKKERSNFPNRFWKGKEGKERAAIVTKYLIRNVLGWNRRDIIKKFSQDIFIKNKLGGMLTCCFNKSPYKALESAYPGRFRPWEFRRKNMWQGKEGIGLANQAIRWLVDEKLTWDSGEIKNKISQNVFFRNGLRGMLISRFNLSPYKALDSAYPGRFKREEFRYFQEEAKLGDMFEKYLKEVFNAIGYIEGVDYLYKKKDSSNTCCPDFQFMHDTGWDDEWVDAKLGLHTILSSDTMKYTGHCKKLTIIYLVENIKPNHLNSAKSNDTRFISIDSFYPRLNNFGRLDIIEKMEKLKSVY